MLDHDAGLVYAPSIVIVLIDQDPGRCPRHDAELQHIWGPFGDEYFAHNLLLWVGFRAIPRAQPFGFGQLSQLVTFQGTAILEGVPVHPLWGSRFLMEDNVGYDRSVSYVGVENVDPRMVHIGLHEGEQE